MTLAIGESFGGGQFSDILVTLKSKTSQNMIVELKGSGTFNKATREIKSQVKSNYGQMDQFMSSDTAVICKEMFKTCNRYDNGGGSVYVDGNVFSYGGIKCGWNSTIKGDTFGYNEVSVDQGIVDGDLYSTGNVKLGWDAKITGDVTSRGTITTDGSNNGKGIGGEVFGSQKVTLGYDTDVGKSVKSLSDVDLKGANNIMVTC